MVSHFAAWSRCCILPGVASPACSAIVQQFLRGRSLINAPTYFFAVARGSHLRKHPAIEPISSSRHRLAASASTMATVAAPRSLIVTHQDHRGGCLTLRTDHQPPRSQSTTAVLASTPPGETVDRRHLRTEPVSGYRPSLAGDGSDG